MTVVKSAGNNGTAPGAVTSPADAEGVIVVGATDRRMRRVQPYSSRGATLNGLKRPHLVAPGGSQQGEIVTCNIQGRFGIGDFGTSHAAAFVSGVLALMLEAEPGLTPEEQREKLLDLCDPIVQQDEDAAGRGFLKLDKLP